jgi:hypothetical protein
MTAPITSAKEDASRSQGRSIENSPISLAPIRGGVTEIHGTYFGYISIAAATVT